MDQINHFREVGEPKPLLGYQTCVPCILSIFMFLIGSAPLPKDTPPTMPVMEMFDMQERITLLISESSYVNSSSDLG